MISLKDYDYDLPDHRIAKYPLEERNQSKLLVFKGDEIKHSSFSSLVNELPNNSSLYFNDTKVIPARLFFQKETGANIEIFLLHPISPTPLVQLAMEETGPIIWECMIGNAKKWKGGQILKKTITIVGKQVEITAKRIDESKHVELNWNSNDIFSNIVEALGDIPLPPYLDRDTEESDLETYQTVYSKEKGAVAAPTAGLHFTEKVFNQLDSNNIPQRYLTLHVGAGTFMPVKHDNVMEHPMHNEQIVINRTTIENLLSDQFIIPVGTTSMRSLESLFWFGQLLEENSDCNFFIPKLAPYEANKVVSKEKALKNILVYMDKKATNTLIGETEIFIFPGYKFGICNALITNFHQPCSTLLMLISALVGEEWKTIYQDALNNDYRFLSYGDSSLLFPKSN